MEEKIIMTINDYQRLPGSIGFASFRMPKMLPKIICQPEALGRYHV